MERIRLRLSRNPLMRPRRYSIRANTSAETSEKTFEILRIED
jgi:hypothetical protein